MSYSSVKLPSPKLQNSEVQAWVARLAVSTVLGDAFFAGVQQSSGAADLTMGTPLGICGAIWGLYCTRTQEKIMVSTV